MPVKRLAVAAVLLAAALPASAQARAPKTIARPGRLDFGPVLSGGRVAYAAAPFLRLVTPAGHASGIDGIPSPVDIQPARAHAATPEGTLSDTSDLLSFSSDAVAWQEQYDHVDPSFDHFQSASASFRSPIAATGSQFLGGWNGEGGEGQQLVCASNPAQPVRELTGLALSDAALAYVAEEPPTACPQAGVSQRARLIARTVAQGVLGPERVLGEGTPTPGAQYPFVGLKAAGPFVAWLAPSGSARFTATVADVSTGATVYQVPDLVPNGIELDADGTLAIGQQDGSVAWASPAAPTLHSLGQGAPLAIARGTVLVERAHALRLESVDGSSRPLAAAGHRAGAADYDGTYAASATVGKRCRRVRVRRHGARHGHPRYRRVCRRQYRIQLQRVG